MASETHSARLAHRVDGSGVPLVLVAGTGYPGATWPPGLIEPLAERYAVITFDHRGTGASPGTDDRYSTRLFAADLAALLEEVSIPRAHVLGHSMGGRVAQWLALDAPSLVTTLILAASGPGQLDPDRPQTRGVPVETALRLVELGYESYMRTLISSSFFTDEFRASQPERVDWLVDAFWTHRPGLEDYLKHVAARQEHDTSDRLSEIVQPTLVVVGDRDTRRGGTGSHWDQSIHLAEKIPNAELRVVADAKHGYFWSATGEVVTILSEWIDRHEAHDA